MSARLSVLMSAARPVLPPFAAMGVLWGAFAACVPDQIARLGLTEAGMGLLLLFTPVAAVAAMLAAPVAGRLLGRVALPVATAAMGLAFVLPGWAPGAMLFALAMLAAGATTGMTDVLMNARVAAIENDRILHLMNLCHAVYSLGYAAAALATGALRAAGYGPGVVLGLAGAVVVVIALAALERDGRILGLSRPAKGAAGRNLGWLPVLGGGVVLIAFLSENAAESWSALHIEKTLGGSPAEGAAGPAVLALTMGLARLAGQGLITRLNPFRLLSAGAVVAATGAAVAAAASTPTMAHAGFIIMGLGASVIAPTAFSLVGRLAAPASRARAVARATMLGYMGYFFGPPILGFVASLVGLRGAFGVAAVALLAVLVLAPAMRRASSQG
ncbi:MAG: MFS transporter [Gemmobacter sp.]|nr:MFS transporter [Gemmobacter sp.]